MDVIFKQRATSAVQSVMLTEWIRSSLCLQQNLFIEKHINPETFIGKIGNWKWKRPDSNPAVVWHFTLKGRVSRHDSHTVSPPPYTHTCTHIYDTPPSQLILISRSNAVIGARSQLGCRSHFAGGFDYIAASQTPHCQQIFKRASALRSSKHVAHGQWKVLVEGELKHPCKKLSI